MTHPSPEFTVPEELMELLTQQGLAGLPQAIAVLLNEAMKIERSQTLHAAPYERTARGHTRRHPAGGLGSGGGQRLAEPASRAVVGVGFQQRPTHTVPHRR